MDAIRAGRGAVMFYTATIDGRKVLLYAAVGACVVLAAVMVLQPEHAAAAGKIGRTGHFIHKEIGRSQLGKGIAHKAVNILRDGHDTTINGKTLTTYHYKTLFPTHGTPTSPEMLKDAFKEYAQIYGEFGRKLLHIIREIGLKGARGEFPYAPPGFFHVGPGVGPEIPM